MKTCVFCISQCMSFQKQPSSGFLRKRFFVYMHQIYRRTPMPKCDFNKVAKQLFEIIV